MKDGIKRQGSDSWNKASTDPMGKKPSSGYQVYPKPAGDQTKGAPGRHPRNG